MVKGKVPAFSWLLAWMQFRGWHGGRSLRHLRDFVLKKKKTEKRRRGGRGGGRIGGAIGINDTTRTGPLESTDWDSKGLKEI